MNSLTLARFVRSIFWVTLAFLLLELILGLLLTHVLAPVVPDEATRGILVQLSMGVVLLLWLIWSGVLLLAWLYRSTWMRRFVAGHRGPSGPLADAIGELHARQADAERALKGLLRQTGRAPRPWLLLLGASGAGKSSAIRASELSVHRLDARGGTYEVAPTMTCDWLHCGDAVLVDTPGRYTTSSNDREEWLALLHLLKERRPRRPIDGVVLCVDLNSLLGLEGHAANVLGEQLRRQLDDVVQVLGIAPPAHLLLTHVDALAGFQGWSVQQGQVADQAWGFTFPAAAHARQDLSADLIAGMTALLAHLESFRQRAVCGASSAGDARQVLLFSGQLQAAIPPMEGLVRNLTAMGALANRAPLVGVWLSSARPAGAPSDLLAPALERAFGLRGVAVKEGERRERAGRPYFLKQLFATLFPTPVAAMLVAEGERRAQRRRRRWLYGTALGVVTCGGAIVAGVGISNVRLIQAAESQLYAIREQLLTEQQPPTAELLARATTLGLLAGAEALHPGANPALDAWACAQSDLAECDRGAALRVAPARYGLRQDVSTLLDVLAGSVVETASKTLQIELAALQAASLPSLANRSETASLPAQVRSWATRSWYTVELAHQWRRLQAVAPDEADEHEVSELRKQVARGIASLLGRVREAEGTTNTNDNQSASLVEALLAERWLVAQGVGFGGPALPDQPLELAVRTRLDPIELSDLLYSVSLESLVPPPPVQLNSTLVKWRGKGALLAGPAGFTVDNCTQFERSLEESLASGSFSGYRGVEASDMGEVARQARLTYSAGSREQWEIWIEGIQVPEGASGVSTFDTMRGELERIYRPKDGDLELILAHIGRGAPPPPAPVEGGSAAETPSAFCSCQAKSWGLSGELVGGALQKDLADTQAAMLDLAGQLEALPQDAGARLAMVRDTFGQKSALSAAQQKSADLLSRMDLYQAQEDLAECGGEKGAELRDGLVRGLVEQVTIRSLNLVWSSLLRDYQAQVQRDWTERVLTPWSRVSLFPINPSSSADADPEEIKKIAGSGGELDAFIADHLAPLLDRGQQRAPLWIQAPHLVLSPEAVAMIRARSDVSAVIDQIDGTWNISLKRADRQPKQVDGRPVTFLAAFPKGAAECIDSFEGSKTVCELAVTAATQVDFRACKGSDRRSSCASLPSPRGSWALFRLLSSSYDPVSSTEGELHLNSGAASFAWSYQELRRGPYTTLRLLGRLGLPADLLTVTEGP